MLLIANVEGTLLAYRDVCAACGGRSTTASSGGALACRALRALVLPAAGGAVDG